MHAILQEIDMTMMGRARLEAVRADLIERAAIELGCEQHEVTSSRLRAFTDNASGAEITRCADELRGIVEELNQIVARNRALLEHELAVIETMVRGMTEDRSATPVYEKNGAQREAVRLKLLDAQV